MYTGRVACCPLMSHGKYADRTDRQADGQTPDRYITLSAKRGQRDKMWYYSLKIYLFHKF